MVSKEKKHSLEKLSKHPQELRKLKTVYLPWTFVLAFGKHYITVHQIDRAASQIEPLFTMLLLL